MKTKDLRTKVTAKIHHVGQSPAFVTLGLRSTILTSIGRQTHSNSQSMVALINGTLS
jgi:hypothetical protein